MDFAYHYTHEQQRFRREVTDWLEANLPSSVAGGGSPDGLSPEGWERVRSAQRTLGDKGWLAPTEPPQQGGSGLSPECAVVLLEELDKRGLRSLVDESAAPLRRALRQWGSEEQRHELLPAIGGGRVVVWRITVEAGAEPDTGALGVRTHPDGDGFILNGEAAFTGQGLAPSHLWTLALADPDASTAKAIHAFLMPANLDGVSVHTPRTLVEGVSHRVAFDDVWVPRNCLLGEEGEGWRIMETAMLEQPSLDLPPPGVTPEVSGLLRYARETTHEGVPLSEQPVRRQLLVEAYIDSRMTRLFKLRDQWMRAAGVTITYEPAQTAMLEERAAMRLSRIVRDVAGVYALLDSQDMRAPAGARFEAQQRESLARQDSSGAPDAHRGAIARSLGLGSRKFPSPLTGEG